MNETFQFQVGGGGRDLMLTLSLCFAGLLALAHLLMAIGVAASVLQRHEYGRRVAYLGAPGWFLVVLVFGLMGLLSYWLIHHSTLSVAGRTDNPAQDERAIPLTVIGLERLAPRRSHLDIDEVMERRSTT